MSKTAREASSFTLRPFQAAPDDPLTPEHALISAWKTAALSSLPDHRYYEDVDLKSLPEGQAIFDAASDQARRLILAAIVQMSHYDAEVTRSREFAQEGSPNGALPGWNRTWGTQRQLHAVFAALVRRALPFSAEDLIVIIHWCAGKDGVNYFAPHGYIVKAIQRQVAAGACISPALRQAIDRYAEQLRLSRDNTNKRQATSLMQLISDGNAGGAVNDDDDRDESAPASPSERLAVIAAPAGHFAVLDNLKRALNLPLPDLPVVTGPTGPDEFPLRADSPLRAEHELLNAFFPEVIGTRDYARPSLDRTATGQKIRSLDEMARGRVFLAAAERAVAAIGAATDYANHAVWQSQHAAAALTTVLDASDLAFDRDGVFDALVFIGGRSSYSVTQYRQLMPRLIVQAATFAEAGPPLTDGERYVLHLLRAALLTEPVLGVMPEDGMRLTKLVGDGARFFLAPGEAWTDALNDDLAALPAEQRGAWIELLKHALSATAARPSDKWLKTASKLMNAIGTKPLVASLERWLPLVARGRTVRQAGGHPGDARSAVDVMNDQNATALRGFLWMLPGLKSAGLARLATAVATTAYKKVPGVGPRAVKVGNAAVYALSLIATEEAVGQLALLKVKVKFGTAQKEIEKAFNHAAEALGLPRDQIEEMGVPTYGLETVGHRREVFGEYAADLHVEGRDASISWSRVADGKAQKSVPAKVKAEHKEDLKELQQSSKDIAAMLPAQAERIDAMFLLEKRWPLSQWKERYLDHALIGTIARRLIWVFRDPNGTEQSAGIWHEGKLVDASDRTVEPIAEYSVELWHPIGRPLDDVLGWRAWLDRRQVRQPFKQAHREVYLLTDAERNTRVYSNRFAAHVIRQHQFNALCGARGWRNRLRLMVDDAYPPATKELPTFNLRAEYWIEGIGDNYGTDTTDSGAYVRLATDQVRFYRTTAATNLAHAGGGGYAANAYGPGAANVNEPVPLEEIPPLALSEVMRDVDLFVGVASVGNDPAWQDGGPQGRYRDYWHNYSFGDLGATAQTRRDVLGSLIPRLKIRDRASLSERFLVVRGNLRTYKIHLGSGNILMEPNDQYLCIVPNRSTGAGTSGPGEIFLPFEGDQTLSVIISKAFMLAADDKITDSTITRQIRM